MNCFIFMPTGGVLVARYHASYATPIAPVHLHHLYLDVLERGEAGGRLSDTGNGAGRESVDRVHFALTLLQPPRDALERSEPYGRTFCCMVKHGRPTCGERRTRGGGG